MNRLSSKLINSLASKLGKNEQYVRQQISKRARREHIPSEVALVNWANERGIPTSTYVRSLGPVQQAQVYSQPAGANNSQKPQILRIHQFGKDKDKWYNTWWVQWFVVGLLIATVAGTLSQIIGTYFTNLFGLTRP